MLLGRCGQRDDGTAAGLSGRDGGTAEQRDVKSNTVPRLNSFFNVESVDCLVCVKKGQNLGGKYH